MAYIQSYYVGLDLGQKQDYTALAVLEEGLWVPDEETRAALNLPAVGWLSPAAVTPNQREQVRSLNYLYGRPAQPPLKLRHLERFALGTAYPAIVRRVTTMMHTPPLRGDAVLVVDATGVGAPVVDEFRLVLEGFVEVTITAGTAVSADDDFRYRVPKRDLVSATRTLLDAGRLQIDRGMPDADTLVQELLNFKMTIDPRTAHDSYAAWREGQHDDLVLATALACWFRGYWHRNLDEFYAHNVPHAAR